MKQNLKHLFFIIFLLGVALCTISCSEEDDDNSTELVFGSVTDIDANEYKTIEIGTQTWMAENLKVTKYNNGDPIPIITDYAQWDTLLTGAYCIYENNSLNNLTYGKLYNFYAVTDSRDICPTGWHVPTNEEWITLITYSGGELQAGNKLKEEGTAHWSISSFVFTNESGFTALPGGYRFVLSNNGYEGIFHYGRWWTSTVSTYNTDNALYRVMGSETSEVGWGSSYKSAGYSIRCIKD